MMTTLPAMLLILMLSNDVQSVQPPPQAFFTPVVKSSSTCRTAKCHKHIKAPKSRLFVLSVPSMKSDIDEDDYDDNDSDDIIVQSVIRSKEFNKKNTLTADDIKINNRVAERLAMIKWVVMAKLAEKTLKV